MTTPIHERNERQLAKYGLSEEAWHELWDFYNGHCPICIKPFSSTRLPCVDHDHETGRIRGLLCTDCNYFLGEQHDKSAKLRRAADYLDGVLPGLEKQWPWFTPGSPGAPRGGGRTTWSDGRPLTRPLHPRTP